MTETPDHTDPETPDPDERRSCGCPLDYHMSDCPILTDRGDDEPYDFDWDYDAED